MAGSIRRRRKRTLDRYGVVLMGGVGCVILTLIGLSVYFHRQQVRLDPQTLCPVAGPRALTVLLMDLTDPLTVVQQGALQQRWDPLKNTLEQYAGISIYTVEPIGNQLLRPQVPLRCNPGRGEGVPFATGNPLLVEKKWRTQFSDPLDRAFGALLQQQPRPAPTSPIMESIQSVTITALREAQIGTIPRRLVIVSDMLQHTSDYSQYQMIRPFTDFQQSQYYDRVRTDLRGIKVEIIYVRRNIHKRVQGKHHIEFWQQYIAVMGGVLTHVLPLEG